DTSAFSLYEGNLLGAFQGDRLLKIRAPQIIVCTGGRQRPMLFHSNDLPGIFLSRALLRLARLYGVQPGQRAVVVTDTDEGALVARRLRGLGIEVAAIVDRRPEPGARASAYLEHFPVPQIAGGAVLEALGRRRLKAIRVGRVNTDGAIDAQS